VIVLPSSFEIVLVGIKNIDRKQLTVDLEVALRIYKPLAGDQPKSMPIQMFNDHWDFRSIDVPLSSSEKYEYYLTTDLNGIHLIGDASLYPFDNYYLGLNFTGPPTATASMNSNYVGPYQGSEHYIWEFNSTSIVDIGEYFSTIRVRIDFNRRLENAYYVFLPLVFGFFILGGTPMLSIGKNLQARLTTYVALFVFAMQYAFTINSAVPIRASGVTLAEIALISLACYIAVYIVASIVGNFLIGRNGRHEAILSWAADVMGASLVFYLLFCLVLVRTPYDQRTLFDAVSLATLKWPYLGMLMIGGLTYGLIVRGVSLARLIRHSPMYARLVRLAESVQNYQNPLVGSTAAFLVLFVTAFLNSPSAITTVAIAFAAFLFFGILWVLSWDRTRKSIGRVFLRRRYTQPHTGVLTIANVADDDLKRIAKGSVFAPHDWVEGLVAQGLDARTMDSVNIEVGFDIIINPFGERYLECDMANMRTLKEIKRFVKRGGVFVNVAGLAFFYMYDPSSGKEGLTGSYHELYEGRRQIGGTPRKPSLILEPVINPDASSLTDTWLFRNLGLRTTLCSETTRVVTSAHQEFSDLVPPGLEVREYRAAERCELSEVALLPILKSEYRYADTSRMHECYPIAAVRYGLGFFMICGMIISDASHRVLVEKTIRRLADILARQGDLDISEPKNCVVS
jgi:hypothetical protein